MTRRTTATLLATPLLAVALLGASCGDLLRREPRKSQPAQVMQRMGRARITVTYNRPVARGRVLFGGIVPWGETWDPGADEATTIELTRDVLFGGQPLDAGRYSVWAIPQPTEWTLILSRASDVPHVPYPEGRDALRIRVRPEVAPHMESLAFYFPMADTAQALLALHWGTTRLTIPIARR